MPKPGMLNLIEIMKATGFERPALNRYLAIPAVRNWLGGEEHPLYHESRMGQFHQMLAQSKRGVKPQAFAIGISADHVERDIQIREEPDSELPVTENRLPEISKRLTDTEQYAGIGAAAAGAFADVLIERVRQSGILPPVEDRFLTREQAAELLACKLSAVGRRVRPVMAETWSHIHIQAFMAAARARAESRDTHGQK